MIKLADLDRCYPDVLQAIAWTELIICQSSDGEETSWELILRSQPNISPYEMLSYMKEAIEGETVGRAEEAKSQMNHPQYLRYLAGKLGAF
jgi:hypothetical protein